MSITKTKKKAKSSSKKSISSKKTEKKGPYSYAISGTNYSLQPGGRGKMINPGGTPTMSSGPTCSK